MSTPPKPNPTLFISYSHKDEAWKDQLRSHLEVIEPNVEAWDDRAIEPGSDWNPEIGLSIERADAAVCLITGNYLASEFCQRQEVPALLERKRAGMPLIPVLVEDCNWRDFLWLREIQLLPGDGRTVQGNFAGLEEDFFEDLVERLWRALGGMASSKFWQPPEQIDIGRLPMSGARPFGRQLELHQLDAAWNSYNTHVATLVGSGGVGKSTLVEEWLEKLSRENYRGARRIYGWSFYSQGSGERVTSADQFIAEALAWFGHEGDLPRSPWERANSLARLIRQKRTLLICDGIEPLQSEQDYNVGLIRDPALARVIIELARENHGLVVITSRLPVADLKPFKQTIHEQYLNEISMDAGVKLLRHAGLSGTEDELKEAARLFGNYPLALTLLAAYLKGLGGNPGRLAAAIPDIAVSDESGRHARRVMAAFERRFEAEPELDLLSILGLFDRPCDDEALAALRRGSPISGLTERIGSLTEEQWEELLRTLRETRLILPKSHHDPTAIDAHPLVREHFRDRLKGSNPTAWRVGNDRLYRHFAVSAPSSPSKVDDLTPLYLALKHGCDADRHQEVLDEIFWKRLLKGNAQFSWRQIGAIGSDLAAIAQFFEVRWSKLVEEIKEKDAGFVIGQAGIYLGMVGRLEESLDLLEEGMQRDIAQKNLANASITAGNLGHSYLILGHLSRGLDYARQSVELADKAADDSERSISRTTMAHILHWMGRLDEAHKLFKEAEAQQRAIGGSSFLRGGAGYEYAELLLDQGFWSDVQGRARANFKAMGDESENPHDHIALGLAILAEHRDCGTGDLDEATNHLELGLELLRQGGQFDLLPIGLLSRAKAYQLRFEQVAARADLEEALELSRRCGMRLYEADALLAYARLSAEVGERSRAKGMIAEASGLIERMGHRRRDQEVTELKGRLR